MLVRWSWSGNANYDDDSDDDVDDDGKRQYRNYRGSIKSDDDDVARSS